MKSTRDISACESLREVLRDFVEGACGSSGEEDSEGKFAILLLNYVGVLWLNARNIKRNIPK
jgi:hypothetical protein